MGTTQLGEKVVLDSDNIERQLSVDELASGELRVRLNEERKDSGVSFMGEWNFEDIDEAATFWYENRVFDSPDEAAATAFFFSDLGYGVATSPAQRLVGFAEEEDVHDLFDVAERTVDAGCSRASARFVKDVVDEVNEHKQMLEQASEPDANELIHKLRRAYDTIEKVWETEAPSVFDTIERAEESITEMEDLREVEKSLYTFADAYVDSVQLTRTVRDHIKSLDNTRYITDDRADEDAPYLTMDWFNEADRAHHAARYQVLHAERLAARIRNVRLQKERSLSASGSGRT